jgi:hypothetical protein
MVPTTSHNISDPLDHSKFQFIKTYSPLMQVTIIVHKEFGKNNQWHEELDLPEYNEANQSAEDSIHP